jgi:hypothetical protein
LPDGKGRIDPQGWPGVVEFQVDVVFAASHDGFGLPWSGMGR